MSSILRTFSQIPSQIRYFLGVEGGYFTDGNDVVTNECSIIRLNNGQAYPGAIALAADLDPIFDDSLTGGGGQPMTGKLYKDMGRSITVVDSAGRHISVYRNVQFVNGPGSEGVGGISPTWISNIYVLVWSAGNPDHVVVARTG